MLKPFRKPGTPEPIPQRPGSPDQRPPVVGVQSHVIGGKDLERGSGKSLGGGSTSKGTGPVQGLAKKLRAAFLPQGRDPELERKQSVFRSRMTQAGRIFLGGLVSRD